VHTENQRILKINSGKNMTMQRNIFFIGRVFIVASLFLLSACADPNYSKVPPTVTNVAPESPAAPKLGPYKVQIGDVLDVNLYMNPELNETVTVRPDGMISTKIAEDMYVYDKTPLQITTMLKKKYKRILSDPSMTTVVRSFAPIRIYVSGEVVTPGEYLVVGQPLTLTQAIARAGGIKNSGMQDKVLIIRRGAGEKGHIFVADYFGATQGADPDKDTRLASLDVVFVPKSGVALGYVKYQQDVQQFINPGVGVGAAYTFNR
jgi:polysaccharide export outer membrane protein